MVARKKGGASSKSLADIVINRPQPLSRIDLPIIEPRFNDGEIFFLFSKAEINKSAEPFCFSMVLKFL